MDATEGGAEGGTDGSSHLIGNEAEKLLPWKWLARLAVPRSVA